MRKTLKVLGVASLLVAAVITMPMSAEAGRRSKNIDKNEANVTIKNFAKVTNVNFCVSNTGDNEQKFTDDDNKIETGKATTSCGSVNTVNTNVVNIKQKN